ncbi:uncharacterized protein LOC101461847 [Ceratitis capitata]|uniref:(Mediterranean fruit fly) hypothetical protein n=1 Tax=Ceratitis capitata TaxID=7213 RepID=W8BXB3_CERCA|nr:uncharacterized protein LOC101461847 [Ceratitis capitata]CAD7011808.1 unnamed protein product [Ceratitis capitata]
MVRIRGIKCGVADDNHKLTEPSTIIKNPKLIEFIRHRRKDFRGEEPVCEKCAQEIKKLYMEKMRRAGIAKQQKRSLELSSSITDIDETVTNRKLRVLHAGKKSTTTTTTATTAGLSQEQFTTSQSTLDEGPSTSAAAASKLKRKLQKDKRRTRHIVADNDADVDTNDDDDEFVPSPNALNGTRLPNIQPIPKRRKFVHANPDVLNIYMAGLTGG